MNENNDQHPYHAPASNAVPESSPITDKGATPALIAGIIGLVLCPLVAIAAVVMGHKSLGRIKRSNGTLTGEGLALGGLITGYIALAFSIVVSRLWRPSWYPPLQRSLAMQS